MKTSLTAWVAICRRTNDPKLAWIQQQLAARGIPSRRDGESRHAPILTVPTEHEEAAWAFLGERWKRTRYTIDDIRDDHPAFAGAVEPTDDDAYLDEQSLNYFNRYIAGDR